MKVKRGQSFEIQLHVRNFNSRPQAHRIEVQTPPALLADTRQLEGKLARASRASPPIHLRATADAQPGIHLVAFDVTLDDERYGQRFDCIVEIEP